MEGKNDTRQSKTKVRQKLPAMPIDPTSVERSEKSNLPPSRMVMGRKLISMRNRFEHPISTPTSHRARSLMNLYFEKCSQMSDFPHSSDVSYPCDARSDNTSSSFRVIEKKNRQRSSCEFVTNDEKGRVVFPFGNYRDYCQRRKIDPLSEEDDRLEALRFLAECFPQLYSGSSGPFFDEIDDLRQVSGDENFRNRTYLWRLDAIKSGQQQSSPEETRCWVPIPCFTTLSSSSILSPERSESSVEETNDIFLGRRLLDVGCNSGELTIALGMNKYLASLFASIMFTI